MFLCQGCSAVVLSDDWEKYHIKPNSCPYCSSDMCGCPECVKFIKDMELRSDDFEAFI